MKTSLPSIFLALASLALLSPLVTPVQATDFTWTALGIDRYWGDRDNWAGGTGFPGASPFDNDTALFPVLSQSYLVEINNSSFPYVAGITFATPGYALQIGATTLHANGGITATVANAPDFEVNGGLVIGGPTMIRNLTGSGFISTSLNSSTLTQVGPAGNFTGAIRDSGGNETTALTVGDGTQTASLTLNPDSDGPNNYTGTTRVQTNATLVNGAAGALAADSPHVIDGTLDLTAGPGTVKSLSGTGTVSLGVNTLTITNGGTFAGTMNGTGTTIVSGGRFALNGSTTGGALVQSGADLGGSGTIGGPVTVQSGGTLSPGNSPDQLTLLSDLTLNSGSSLEMEFDGTAPGLYDQLDVQGLFAAGGTLSLTIDEGFTPVSGESFTLFNGATPGFDSGSFALSSNLPDGLAWDTSALATTGVVTVVPEPSTWALLISALLFTWGWVRRSGSRDRSSTI